MVFVKKESTLTMVAPPFDFRALVPSPASRVPVTFFRFEKRVTRFFYRDLPSSLHSSSRPSAFEERMPKANAVNSEQKWPEICWKEKNPKSDL